MGISRFQELVAWQKARQFCKEIYAATREARFARDFGLSGQIQRAAVSIMSNISEGFERNKPAEFHQFLSVSKSSCAEVRSQLYVAMDVGYLSTDSFGRLLAQGEELARIIGGLRSSIERRRLAGSRTSRLPAQHSALSTQH
jgi:four helix bundle protein